MFKLPIDAHIPDIVSSLAHSPRLIIRAEPGAGKTTRTPLALLDAPWLAGQKILLLEPRRLAARAAARHMAQLLGESVGQRVGFRTALEAKDSAQTRILVVTEGILTRMLQQAPDLPGVGCVIFDEFHERSLEADLGLALTLDTQTGLRPELRLLVMSATLDPAPLVTLLEDCPVCDVPGRSFPVLTRYLAPERPNMRLEDRCAAAVLAALHEEEGNLLVFLPGAAEIRRTAERLCNIPDSIAVHPLYGDMDSAAQDAAIAPPPPGQRKVVLATNIAESSLTIEGVRLVIDSGLVRRQRVDPEWGMSRLVTERVSQAEADQRRGRAGRTQAGVCWRLWPEHEHAALRPFARPSILDDDLSGLCLELALWGVKEASALRWLDLPPDNAWSQAQSLLHALDALDAHMRITPRGRDMAALPLPPRLAHMVLLGRDQGQGLAACALAALLSERDPLRVGGKGGPDWGADVSPRLALLLDGGHHKAAGRLQDQMRRLCRRLGLTDSARSLCGTHGTSPGLLLAAAWPERIALRRASGTYIMANGRGAALRQDDPLLTQPCLAIAALDAGAGDARIHLAAPLDLADVERVAAGRITTAEVLSWDASRHAVSARRVRRLDALVLDELPLAVPRSEATCTLLLEGLATMDIGTLPWGPETRQWRERVLFMRHVELAQSSDSTWPDVTDTTLCSTLPLWLGPYLSGHSRLSDLSPALLDESLRSLLSWEQGRRLDALAPGSLSVPSGSTLPLDYSTANAQTGPVLTVKLQEMFGLTTNPHVADGRVAVILHLVSPAGRPVQITSDLGYFWQHGYPAVRAELRGRYPKHPWPENPLTATPTRHTKRRMEKA